MHDLRFVGMASFSLLSSIAALIEKKSEIITNCTLFFKNFQFFRDNCAFLVKFEFLRLRRGGGEDNINGWETTQT